MEDQKIINFLVNIPNQPSKIKTRIWVEINDNKRWTYDVSNQIKWKTLIVRSILRDYSNA